MIQKIIKTYIKLNNELIKEMPFNDDKTRKRIAVYLESKLDDCNIICDETNNTPDIINSCICVAKVLWLTKNNGYSYVDLIFGRPEQIELTNDKMNLL